MSDNVIRPGHWFQNGQRSLEQEPASAADAPIEPGGGGPHDPGMEARIAALEGAMTEVKMSLGRIEGTLSGLATKADLATLTERVSGLDKQMARMEATVSETLRVSVGKAIGPWQLPALLAACLSSVGAMWWVVHQPWFPH